MATKRHEPEEIVSKLRQVDVLVGQGLARIDAIRRKVNSDRRTLRLIDGVRLPALIENGIVCRRYDLILRSSL